MFDPTILLHLQPAMPPARPDIVIERPIAASPLEVVQRIANQKVSQYEREVAGWIADLQRRRDYIGAVAPTRDSTEDELSITGRVIEDIETEAELRALDLKRLIKRMARDTKRYFDVNAGVGASFRSVGNRLILAEELAIEALLEHALYLRAFRAARSPGARGGPVFDDPHALDAYLRAELA